MKKLLIAGVLGCSIILTGCATPSYNYQATQVNVSKPPLNSINEAYVGDKMLEQGVVVERDALHISQEIKHSGYTFSSGYYLKVGENEKGSYFQALNNIPNGANLQKNVIVDPFKNVMLDEKNELCIVTIFNAKACTEKHDAKLTKINIAADNAFQQTLIYSGKIGNKINIGYREFSSNIARPAFNNDVEYDLNESKQIGYKGAILEVLDADNQRIKYKVLRNFNKVE